MNKVIHESLSCCPLPSPACSNPSIHMYAIKTYLKTNVQSSVLPFLHFDPNCTEMVEVVCPFSNHIYMKLHWYSIHMVKRPCILVHKYKICSYMEFSFMNLYLLKNIRIFYNFYMSSSWEYTCNIC